MYYACLRKNKTKPNRPVKYQNNHILEKQKAWEVSLQVIISLQEEFKLDNSSLLLMEAT